MPVFLTQDGPSHLYNSNILLHYFSDSPSFLYKQYFYFNATIFPNWFSSIILSFILVFFKPLIAEKLFITLLIIALPISFRFVIKTINPQAVFLSSFAFILSNSFFLIYGFYNFQWSLVFFCLFLGYYIRSYNTLSVKQSLVLCILCLVNFITHPVALLQIFFILTLDFLIISYTYLKFKNSTTYIKRLTKLACIGIPSFILFIMFFFNQHNHHESIFVNNFSTDYLKPLFTGNHLWVFSTMEKIVLNLFTLLIILLTGSSIFYFKKHSNKKPTLIITSLICINTFIYFFITDALAGGEYLSIRSTIFIYLMLIIISSLYIHSKTIQTATVIISFTLCLCLLIIRFPYQYKIGCLAKE